MTWSEPDAQAEAHRAAVDAANGRMRAEVLPGALSEGRAEATAAVLRAQWAPWSPEPGDRLAASLDTGDPLVLAVMRDPALLERSRRIMREETERALFASRHTPGVLRSVLEGLVA